MHAFAWSLTNDSTALTYLEMMFGVTVLMYRRLPETILHFALNIM